VKATEGAQTFERLVSQANENVPVRPLFPKNIHSTDDSGVYFVSAHNDTDGCEWRVGRNDGTDTGVKSRYQTTVTSMLMGQRARLTWTVSADGTVATPYISFIGLSIRELPQTTCEDGIMMIPIKGLAVGGVNPDCQSVGYIVLVRSGVEMETHNFANYREHVYRKYVKSKRNLQVGMPIPDDEVAVGFQDGGGPQLKAVQSISLLQS